MLKILLSPAKHEETGVHIQTYKNWLAILCLGKVLNDQTSIIHEHVKIWEGGEMV